MGRGTNSVALLMQQVLQRDPRAAPSGSSGPLRRMVWSQSRPRNSATCWKASTGDTRSVRGGPKQQVETIFYRATLQILRAWSRTVMIRCTHDDSLGRHTGRH